MSNNYFKEMTVFDSDYGKAALFLSKEEHTYDNNIEIEIEITNSLGDTVDVILTEEQAKELVGYLQEILQTKYMLETDADYDKVDDYIEQKDEMER